MIMERMAVRRRIEVPDMAARKRFGRYKKEGSSTVRDADVRQDIAGVGTLLRFWEDGGRSFDYFSVRSDYALRAYKDNCALAKRLDYTAEDVERFSIILAEHQDVDAFWYRMSGCLSTLIDSGADPEYTIHVGKLLSAPSFLGWRNRKDLLVIGDVGYSFVSGMTDGSVRAEGLVKDDLAKGMTGGVVEIFGDAGGGAGIHLGGGEVSIRGSVTKYAAMYMTGGTLTIGGDAGSRLGFAMQGGVVRVKGNAESISDDMAGGEVHVDGEIGSIGDIKGGKIFHKGKLMVDK
jgi:formylmethanofuran dehydrogenase subunit C